MINWAAVVALGRARSGGSGGGGRRGGARVSHLRNEVHVEEDEDGEWDEDEEARERPSTPELLD